MKIEKLNENKIKITLSSDDLRARNIDVQSFIYNTPESQDLFWDVMKEAEKEYGFSVDESMIYVEAAATTSGIFTLTVTKSANSLSPITLRNKLKRQNYKLRRKNITLPLNNSIYRFNTFEDLCDFCSSTDVESFGNNVLYELNSTYYLLVSTMPNSGILEYASKEPNVDILLAELSEYGKKIIADDALKTIAKNFIKSKSR